MLCPSSVPPLPALWIPCHSDGPADGCIAKLKSDHQMSVGEGFEPLAAARGALWLTPLAGLGADWSFRSFPRVSDKNTRVSAKISLYFAGILLTRSAAAC